MARKPARTFELNIRRTDGTVVSVTAENLAQAVRAAGRQAPAEEVRYELTPAGWAAAYRARGAA